MERLFADNGCAERTRKAGLDLWYVIRFKGSAEQVAEDFGEIAGVNHVEIPRKITKVGDVGRRSGTPWRKLMALPKAVPAVSYTHLDVYKRQASLSSRHKSRPIRTVSTHFRILFTGNSMRCIRPT